VVADRKSKVKIKKNQNIEFNMATFVLIVILAVILNLLFKIC